MAGTKRPVAMMPHEPTQPDDDYSDPPTVVGIGASAGGLSALRRLLRAVPDDSGLAFVVVMHLAPDRESLLPELLQAKCAIPVTQVTGDTALEPDHVYIIPPGRNLSAVDSHLRTTELEARQRDRAPIDHFFRTLASVHDGNAVGVVLTGGGADGALGVSAIKARGGLTIAQDAEEAEHDSMPLSALATGHIDLTLPIADIVPAVLRFSSTKPRIRDVDAVAERRSLASVLALLRTKTGRDFGLYKPSTIVRRIARRMQMHHLEDFDAYLARLQGDREETVALADDLLINVTSFFRDPDGYQQLEEVVLPRLMSKKAAGDAMRVWSVGCATGEEPYSLAMLLLEQAQARPGPPRIQIFASDLHEASIAQAREGFYPGDISVDVGAARLERFFHRAKGGYRIREEVREQVIFTHHDLLSDPPFSQLDLIVCRNLLIYLERDVQNDVMVLFHYALRPEGVLMLGASESMSGSELFRTEDERSSLYVRRNVSGPDLRLPVFPSARSRKASPTDPERSRDSAAFERLYQHILEEHAPPSLLVSPDDKVVHLSPRAGRYLVHPGGQLTDNVFKLAREALRLELRSALHAARQRLQRRRSKPVEVRVDGESLSVVLDVQPALGADQDGFVLVSFDEVPPEESEAAALASESGGPEHARELKAELDLTRERLQVLIEEHETSQDEMKASNEELQSTNEELRSTLEELETSKEELQSMNEELQTLNQENQHKVEELAELSGDLQNLLASTDIATLFLDRSLRIMRFTPKVGELFNVRLSDQGRPISDLTSRLGYPELRADAEAVLKDLVPVERELHDDRDRWYLTRVLPYRSTIDRIEGVVVTSVDITARRRSEQALRESEERFRALVDASAEMVWTTDAQGEMAGDSSSWLDFTGQRADQAQGWGWLDAVHPDDRQAVEGRWRRAVEEGRSFYDEYRVFHDASAEYRWTRTRSVPLRTNAGEVRGWVGMNVDIAEQKRAVDELRRSEERHRSLVEQSVVGVARVDLQGAITFANETLGLTLGYDDPRELLAASLLELTHPSDRDASRARFDRCRKQGASFTIDKRLLQKGGGARWVRAHVAPLRDGEGNVGATVAIITDIHERKMAEEALEETRGLLTLAMEASRIGFGTWDFATGEARWDERGRDILGLASTESSVEAWFARIHPADLPVVETHIQACIDGEEAFDLEYRAVMTSGEVRWIHGTGTLQVAHDGSARRGTGLVRDVTHQRETETALQTLNQTLEEQVDARTQEVRDFASRLSIAEQAERRRLARMLHDDLQQLLYGVEVKLGMLRDDLATAEVSAQRADIEKVRTWVADAVAMTRHLTADLVPPILDQPDFRRALEWLGEHMQDLHQLGVELEAPAEVTIEDEHLRTLLFQFVRELLFNVKKHAGTNQAAIRLDTNDRDVTIEVHDEGDGFAFDEDERFIGGRKRHHRAGGFGLGNMRKRLLLLGGQLEVRSFPGDGTSVRLRVPVPRGEDDEA